MLYTYDANGNRMRAEGEQPSADATYDDQDRLLTYGPSSYTYGRTASSRRARDLDRPPSTSTTRSEIWFAYCCLTDA